MKPDLTDVKKRIDELCERLKDAHQTLTNLRSGQFEGVKKAFLTNLGLDQSSIISRLSRLSKWKNLEGLLADVEQYVTQLEDTVLNPERAELLGEYKRWLHGLKANEDGSQNWLKATLEKANRESILQLHERLQVLCKSWKSLESTTSKLVVAAINNEIVRLGKMDRTSNNFLEWMDTAINAISRAFGLQTKERSIQNEMKHSFHSAPQKHISQKFSLQVSNLNQRLLSKRSFSEVTDFCSMATENIDSQWETLKAKLPVFAGQHKILTKQAKSLVSKDIIAWKLKSLHDVNVQLDSLSKVIGKVINAQDILKSIKGNIDSVTGLPNIPRAAKPLIGELKGLSANARKLSASSTLTEYQDRLDELVGKFQGFTTKLENQRERWVAQTAAWINACIKTGLDPPITLQQQLNALREMDGTVDQLGGILKCHFRLMEQVTEVQRTLADRLPKGEFQVYKAVTQLEERHEVSIADLESELGKLDAVAVNDLLALVDKDLLKVRISAKG